MFVAPAAFPTATQHSAKKLSPEADNRSLGFDLSRGKFKFKTFYELERDILPLFDEHGRFRHDEESKAVLYEYVLQVCAHSFCREIVNEQDVEDALHDTYIHVLAGIDRLQEPAALGGYIKTIGSRVKYQVFEDKARQRTREVNFCEFLTYIQSDKFIRGFAVHCSDKRPLPPELIEVQQIFRVMQAALDQMPKIDQEILRRFYVDLQPESEIRAAMNLSPTQFRVRKSRAKSQFGEIARKSMEKGPYRRLREMVAA